MSARGPDESLGNRRSVLEIDAMLRRNAGVTTEATQRRAARRRVGTGQLSEAEIAALVAERNKLSEEIDSPLPRYRRL